MSVVSAVGGGASAVALVKKELDELKSRIKAIRKIKVDGTMEKMNMTPLRSVTAPANRLKVRRELNGHFGKIYAAHWAGDNIHLLSASQDGKLIVWNALTNHKTLSIPLRSSWVMACAYEQTSNRLAACGGLDNVCSIYELGSTVAGKRPVRELSGHAGYISSCRFVTEGSILTSSGDASINLWDISRGEAVSQFQGHDADVMSVSISPTNSNIFASGSVDASVRIWDLRTGKCVHTFLGHTLDVNAVTFFPDGNAVGTGSEDFTCRVFDLRCWSEVECMGNSRVTSAVQCVAFSRSGRLLFAGYDDYNCRAWDLARPNSQPSFLLAGHVERISCLSLSPLGDVLCTGSWDNTIRVWA